jgi:capsular polysaccharide biosynthesis protein
MADESFLAEEEVLEIDLRRYIEVFLKWKYLIAAITILAVVTSGVLSFFVLPPVYETKVVLMVNQSNDRQVIREEDGLESVVNTLSRLPEMTINTYVGQIQSPSLLEKVITKANLNKEVYTPESLARLIDVKAIKDTNLIEVKVRNTDPKLAVNIANTLSESFLDFISENNTKRMTKSLEFLNQQIELNTKELEKAKAELDKFNAQPRSVEFLQKQMDGLIEDLTLYKSNMMQAEVELEQSLAAKMRLEERLANTKETIVVEKYLTKPDGAEQPEVTQVEEINPAYTSLVQSLDQQEVLVAQKSGQLSSLGTVISEIEAEIDELQAELTKKKAEQTKLADKVNSLESTLKLLQEKLTEAQIMKSINLGETTLLIVAPALEPTDPVKPNKKLNIAIAFVLGLMVAVALAFILEHLDNTLKEPEDVEKHLGLPVLGSIPELSTVGKKFSV